MIMNITNFLSNIDKNSQFLLIIIGVISSLLLLTFVINYFNSRKARKILKKQRKYKKKLMEEINSEANNINESIKAASIPKQEIKKEVLEDIEVLDDIEELNIEPVQVVEEPKPVTPSINLNEYEKEEENSAVISYGELCKKFNVEKKEYNSAAKEVMNKVSDIIENKVESKFKPTRYVSPIFGTDEEKHEQAFLNNLKDFRNGLE